MKGTALAVILIALAGRAWAGGLDVLDSGSAGKGDWGPPLWRSAVLAGWGQWYNRQPVKGTVLGALTVGTLAAYLAEDGGSSRSYRQSLNLGGTYFNYTNTDLFLGGFVLLYAYNLVDAAFNARPAQTNASVKSALSVALLSGGARVDYQLIKF
jgi:hypothetical protein